MAVTGDADGQPERHVPATVTRLARELATDIDGLTDRLVAAILAEDLSYAGGSAISEADLRRSCHDNVARLLQTLTDDPSPGQDLYDAPRATGHRRAEQGIPLESVLHAYRLGHRTIWDGLVARARDGGPGSVEGLVDAAGHVWERVDAFSSTVATAYRETERLISRSDDRRHDALVDALLEGRGRERAVAATAASGLDLPEHGRYVVLVLDGTLSGRAAADALSVRGLRSAWRTRADREVGLVSLGGVAPAELGGALSCVAGLRGGMSPVADGLALVDVAHRLAETALRTLPRDARGLGDLDDRLPAALLVTAPDLAARLVDRALGAVLALDPDEREVLLQTLATWLATGGSAGQTATRLFCHRNTVLNRLHRLEALTGRSVDRVDHLTEWSLALLARDVVAPDGP